MKSIFKIFRLACLLVLMCGLFMSVRLAGGDELPLNNIKLPPGFEISIYAGNLPNARR